MLDRMKFISATDLTPLEYMLSILRDEQADPKDRFTAAKEAAPYVHPRLASSSVSVNDKRNIADLSTAELAAILEQERGGREGADAAEAVEGQPDCVH